MKLEILIGMCLLLFLVGCINPTVEQCCYLTENEMGVHKTCWNEKTPYTFYKTVPQSSGQLLNESCSKIPLDEAYESYELLEGER